MLTYPTTSSLTVLVQSRNLTTTDRFPLFDVSDIIEDYLVSLICFIKYYSNHSCNHLILNGFRNICQNSGCTFQVMLQCLVAAVNSKF